MHLIFRRALYIFRRIRFSVIFILLVALPAQAQWYKRVGAVLQRDLSSTLRGMTPAQAGLSYALERAAQQAAFKAATPVKQIHPLQNAVFTLKEKNWKKRVLSVEGTAFAIEETYQGKKYIWGVAASHYLYQNPVMKHPAHEHSVPVPFVVKGSMGMNDVSLFFIPQEFAQTITPLKLATQSVKKGDVLSSIGYWKNRFHVDPVRTVKEIIPTRMVTSLDIEPGTIREGTCGSPVLNQQGEVVGMHVGNSDRRQIGYVVPVSHIRQALQAYHEGTFQQPLLFQGVHLGDIAINEYLTELDMYQGETLFGRNNLFLRHKQIDYEHLELLISPNASITRVVFKIERNPFSSQQTDQNYHTFLISYDLQTGNISYIEQAASGFPEHY